MDDRTSFRFFRSFYDAAKELEDKEMQAEYLMAICEYALDGTEPKLCGVPAALFRLAQPNIEVSRKKSISGAAGGKANGKQTGSKTEANTKQIESKHEANGKQTGSDKGEGNRDIGEGSNNTPPISTSGDTEFETFWSAYPKKVGKQAAKKAFEKVQKSRISLETLLTAIERQKRSDQWSRDFGQYIPNPATWLNQGRWDDVLPEKNGGDRNAATGRDRGEAPRAWNLPSPTDRA